MRRPHPIEVESYRILRSRVDTSGLPPLTRAVVERVVHTTADTTWMGDIVADEAALCAGRAALLAGAPLVVDVRMVAAGITSRDAVVALDLADDELAIERTTRAGTGGLAGAELAIERTTRAGGGAGGRDAVGGGVARGSDMAAERSTRAVAGGRNAVSAAEGSTRAGVSGRVGVGGVGLVGAESADGGSARAGAGGLAGGELAVAGSTRAGGDAGGRDLLGGAVVEGELAAERSTRAGAGDAAGDELVVGRFTRAAAGIRAAARQWPFGAVWVIGNAPTALAELVRLAGLGLVRPALVVGMPVGFVGSVAAKAALRASGLPAVSSTTERGGAAVAVATVNALLYADPEPTDA